MAKHHHDPKPVPVPAPIPAPVPVPEVVEPKLVKVLSLHVGTIMIPDGRELKCNQILEMDLATAEWLIKSNPGLRIL